ncbi:MAG: pseudaminic acid synthase [Sulfurifustis sp.]
MSNITIGNRQIGGAAPPFIVAEISANHNGSLERAIRLIEAAASAGVHAVKLQTLTPEGLTLNSERADFVIDDRDSPWSGRSLYELYREACTPWEWHEPLFERARNLGLVVFSTPFEEKAVDFLEQLDTPCYKIASFENADLPLIERAAATGKPLIISTGMASIAELDETVRAARAAGCTQLVLLKCTSTYPATPTDSNLLTIPHMRELFGCDVGLSDHTLGIGAAVASVALGAVMIEKHFTLRRADGGVDSTFSMEPEEMRALVAETERAWQALGDVRYGSTRNEEPSLKFRRSLYIAEDMRAGELLTERNLRIVRPGLGLPPKYYRILLGKKIGRDVEKGTPFSWDLLD